MFNPACIVQTEQSSRFIRAWKAKQTEQRAIFFLGGNTLQLPGIYFAQEMNLTVHLADANPQAPGIELADFFHHIDLKDVSRLAITAKRIKTEQGLNAVLTIGTDFSISVAYVAQYCDLPGITHEAAVNASYKHRMRHVLQEAGLPIPRFAVIDKHNRAQAINLMKNMCYPLVIKPADNMGARGVKELGTAAGLDEALNEAFGHSWNGVVLAEEKIIGAEYSLDSLVSKGNFYPLGIARRYIDYPPYFIERGHSFPSDLPVDDEHKMFVALQQAALALGIDNGAAKGDIFLTDRGPVIGEVAARLSGGFMSGWTFPLHSGIHPTIGAILIALGEEIPADFLASGSCHPVSERGLISIPGTIGAIVDSTSGTPAEASSQYRFISVHKGDKQSFPHNNVEKCGNIICRGAPKEAEEVVARYLLPLQVIGHDELEKILSTSFPPAFPSLQQKMRNLKKSGKLLLLDEDETSNKTKNKDNSETSKAFFVPDFMLTSPERDWNYRTVPASLVAIAGLVPAFSWESSTAEAIKISCRDLNVLIALVKGGFQAALYYVELLLKMSDLRPANRSHIGRVLPGVFE